jgi:hypothetical protein
MAKGRSKNGDDEKLDPTNLEKVIKLLEAEKPITKKDACSMLNIAYNTTRLGNLIEKHKEKVARDQQRRREKRGTPATPDEIKYVVEEYLEGAAIEAISDTIHRPGTFIKQVLDSHNVPIRARAHDYFKPELIPEGAVRDVFDIGEVVYSARYDSTARVEDEFPHPDERVYRIWLISDRWQQYAYQPASELASLKHLAELGVKV